MVRVPFAVVIPVGPDASEVARCVDVVDSLLHNEPGCAHLVLVDDTPEDRHLESIVKGVSQGRTTTILKNVRQGRGNGWSDGLSTGIAAALACITGDGTLQFVLRLDTDSLVIRPFAHAVQQQMTRVPGAGLLGTFHRFPDGTQRLKASESPVVERMTRLVAPLPRQDEGRRNWHLGFCGAGAIRRDIVRKALANGYKYGEYCQGGGYAVTRALLAHLKESGWLDDPLLFLGTRIGEDLMLTLMCFALGLQPVDFNQPGEVFAVINNGLPFSVHDLLAKEYSVVHSLKVPDEAEVRRFFRERRNRLA